MIVKCGLSLLWLCGKILFYLTSIFSSIVKGSVLLFWHKDYVYVRHKLFGSTACVTVSENAKNNNKKIN